MCRPILFCLAILPALCLAGNPAGGLTPVTMQPPPEHPPVVFVKDGHPLGAIVVHAKPTSKVLSEMVRELRESIQLTTGAELPVLTPEAAAKHQGPLIHIGNWEGSEKLGLAGGKMPVEGFAIKTQKDQVFIVGNDATEVGGVKDVDSDGTAWGIADFLERFAGVRWFWPLEMNGRSIISNPDLIIPPASYSDAPHFRNRIYYPQSSGTPYGKQNFKPLLRNLRAASSWPISIRVHNPKSWDKNDEYVKNRPEIFQKNRDGTRNFGMLDYAHPRTLETYLEEIEAFVKTGRRTELVKGKTVTVSPADFGVNSYSDEAKALWNPDGGRYGQASRVMADFVNRLGVAMKKRFPDLNILYLPYLNYTLAPDGCKFPDNVYVMLCGMPGIAQYKQPATRETEQANIDKWIRISGHPIQDWHYSCWPADRTKAPFQYPNVLQKYYQANRDKTYGTFINGDVDEWQRFSPTLYSWLKLLWNPDFDVKAGLDDFTTRMFGNAAETVREILNLQITGWEESRWPDGEMTAKAVYEISYPRATIERIQSLFQVAHEKVRGDKVASERLAYFEVPFQSFYKEFARVVDGIGLRELVAFKAGEEPVIDGKLDDKVWALATPVALQMKGPDGSQVEPQFPTEVRAVWGSQGITFGIKMTEPEPSKLKKVAANDDHALAWHDDCIEIFIAPDASAKAKNYQFIVNSGPFVADLKEGDETYNAAGLRKAVALGDGFWSMELFIPYSDLDYKKSSSGGDKWGFQISRNRSKGLKGTKENRTSENQRLNASSGGFNSNLSDFSDLTFRE